MTSILKKGAWCQFKIVLLLKGWSAGWDEELSRKIFMIMQTEELRSRYLSGFPSLLTSEKLDLSLDNIIDPIDVGEKKSQEGKCHPGRLTLNPDAYHRQYTMVSGCRRSPLSSPMVHRYQRCGIGHPSEWKHRLLSETPVWVPLSVEFRSGRNGDQGLQDIYFLCGIPLLFWRYGDSMGMKYGVDISSVTATDRNIQWNGRMKDHRLSSWLDDEVTYWKKDMSRPQPLDINSSRRERHRPKTYWSSESYRERHHGGRESIDPIYDGPTDTYVIYLQHYEDISHGAHGPHGQFETDEMYTP